WLQMARGHSVFLAGSRTRKSKRKRDKYLSKANYTYHFASELLRFIRDDGDGFQQIQNCYLRSQLALTLAKQGRYSEARRRLIEATAFLSKSPKVSDSVVRSVIELRSAQVNVLEAARAVQPRSGVRRKKRRILTLLQQAVRAIESAQAMLANHRKNV